MALPLVYNIRNVAARRVATIMTALGIGLVVFIFVWFLALSAGFKKALFSTGRADNMLVMRAGAQSEVQSGLDRESIQILMANPAIATGKDGSTPLASSEIVLIANLKRKDGVLGNVAIRGVSPAAFEVRPYVKVAQGRAPTPGLAELMAGKALSRRFGNLNVGDTVNIGGDPWSIVGIFDSGGSAFESELWGDSEVINSSFQRESFQSLTFRMKDPSQVETLVKQIEEEPRMRAKAFSEQKYYSDQAQLVSLMLSTLGTFIAIVMAIGAVFGALNTMYASVDARTREVATLRAIGFSPGSIYGTFVMESVLIALLGGVIGCLLALPFNGLSTGTTNWSSFSEVAFYFRITPALIAAGLIFSIVLGVVGGLLPAWKAARRPVAAALRAS
jgi:ABC-type lipoprotein release transport system permease subunit